jgi:hypothetical protein
MYLEMQQSHGLKAFLICFEKQEKLFKNVTVSIYLHLKTAQNS